MGGSANGGGDEGNDGDSHLARAQRILAFVQAHRGLLNLLVRARPSLH